VSLVVKCENNIMNTIEIPFNKFIGINKSENQAESLLELPDSENMKNHLGTVHASAQFALAEACSGEYLLHKFSHYSGRIIPVVRKSETKFKKPAKGRLSANASIDPDVENSVIEKLEQKSRVVIPVNVVISDSSNEITMTARIEWFIQKIEQKA